MVRDVQPLEMQVEKALVPISVTESGMVMLFKEKQLKKALFPISVTESGMVTFTT